jgi:hypothetical protein
MASSAHVTLTWHGSTPETSAIEQAFTDGGATHAHADNEDGSTVVVFHLATSHATDILAGQIVGRALDHLRLPADVGKIHTQHD